MIYRINFKINVIVKVFRVFLTKDSIVISYAVEKRSVSFPRRRESRKKYGYSKLLKLKARFISLYAGFPPPRE
jgi:hypothetical protein